MSNFKLFPSDCITLYVIIKICDRFQLVLKVIFDAVKGKKYLVESSVAKERNQEKIQRKERMRSKSEIEREKQSHFIT